MLKRSLTAGYSVLDMSNSNLDNSVCSSKLKSSRDREDPLSSSCLSVDDFSLDLSALDDRRPDVSADLSADLSAEDGTSDVSPPSLRWICLRSRRRNAEGDEEEEEVEEDFEVDTESEEEEVAEEEAEEEEWDDNCDDAEEF